MKLELAYDQVCDIVIDKIREGAPYSVMRMGDGDTIISQPNKKEWSDFYTRVSIRNLGYVLNDNDSITVRDNLELALVGADILGIGTDRHREVNKYWKEQPNIVSNIIQRRSAQTPKICSIDCHIELLKTGKLNNIIEEAKHVVVISPRNIEREFYKKYGDGRTIEYYRIPPEAFFEADKQNSDLFPRIHGEIINYIKRIDRSGQLCIFGAGFVGKNFGLNFKNMGGVALDIGSVFDLWDGKTTRGKDRGVGAKNQQYIL